MSRLTDFGVCHCFKAKGLVLMVTCTFETREFILGQVAYIFKCGRCTASMHSPISFTFIHGLADYPYIQQCLIDLHHTRYSGSV